MLMSKRRITLVLGAGASAAYGFPLGSELRTRLLELDRSAVAASAGFINGALGQLREFQAEFGRSQMASIDAFLARRREYSEIGKRAIASVLLSEESTKKLIENTHPDNWYFYFFNEIASATNWDDLDLSNLKVVTFNYDRSFEHYMISALRHSYGRSLDDVLEKIAPLEVIHVYGTLGGARPNDPNYLPYGGGIDPRKVTQASESLRVIPEGRTTDIEMSAAQSAILEADALCFLGFGYDQVNLTRIAAHATCGEGVTIDGKRKNRRVAYTCLGMTIEEVKRVYFTFRNAFTVMSSRDYPPNFYNANCVSTLRTSQILRAEWTPPVT